MWPGVVDGLQLRGNFGALDTLWSPPLKDLVHRANIRSVNLYCEAMLKTIGYHVNQDGSMQSGVDAVVEFWKKKGVNLNSAYLEDGSGLSPANVISPFQLASVIHAVVQDKDWAADFIPSLPRAGKDGTMKYILRGKSYANRIRAKSGSFSGVRSYTGVVQWPNGKNRIFSLMLNNYPDDKGSNKILVDFMAEIAQ